MQTHPRGLQTQPPQIPFLRNSCQKRDCRRKSGNADATQTHRTRTAPAKQDMRELRASRADVTAAPEPATMDAWHVEAEGSLSRLHQRDNNDKQKI